MVEGQIVLDEPDLPEGVAVEVLLDDDDKLTDHDVSELDETVEESVSQFSRGEFEDAHALAASEGESRRAARAVELINARWQAHADHPEVFAREFLGAVGMLETTPGFGSPVPTPRRPMLKRPVLEKSDGTFTGPDPLFSIVATLDTLLKI